MNELSWLPDDDKTTLAGKASLGGTPKSWTVTFTYENDAIKSVTAA